MRSKSNGKTLRALAEHLAAQLVQDGAFPESESADLATSLVRQWVSYSGRAMLFAGAKRLDIRLDDADPNFPGANCCAEPNAWFEVLARDWGFDPQNLDDVRKQLNRGQAAEVVNRDGSVLRLSVDPGKGACSAESTGKPARPPAAKRDHRKLAAECLKRYAASGVDPALIDRLALSVARQWQRFAGHAAVFVGGRQLQLKFTELPGGQCNVNAALKDTTIADVLRARGIAEDAIPQVLGQFNLGNSVEIRHPNGKVSRLWHDPKQLRVQMKPVEPAPPPTAPTAMPVFCPHCRAVLRPWAEGESEQACIGCRAGVARLPQGG